MSLERIYRHFVRKTLGHAERARKVQSELPITERWRARLLTEALISDLWHSWTNCCRWLILESCRGTHSRNGSYISPRVGDNSWQSIGYIAKHAYPGGKQKLGSRITHFRHEPTWGDRDKLIDIVNALQPQNAIALTTAFGLPLSGPSHVHHVRNACAHKNLESLQQVRALLPSYTAKKIATPSDLAWEVVVGKSSLGIFAWIDDMITIAGEATLH